MATLPFIYSLHWNIYLGELVIYFISHTFELLQDLWIKVINNNSEELSVSVFLAVCFLLQCIFHNLQDLILPLALFSFATFNGV